jgi:hypothetical protein
LGSAFAIASTWSEDSLRPGTGVSEGDTGIGVSELEAGPLERAGPRELVLVLELAAAAAVVALATRAASKEPEIGRA